MNNTILHGSAQDKLKEIESDSVDCCITSPPYWALRDYKTEGQLGLEPTFQEYITKLVDIFSQVRRVLKKSGACWVNLGDTYATGVKGDSRDPEKASAKDSFGGHSVEWFKAYYQDNKVRKIKTGIPEKSLCCIPERFAIAMVDQGWILRNKIIWYKPNCMPSSAKDRFTVDWEYLFFFTKSQRYYFETQYEPYGETERWGGNKMILKPDGKLAQNINASVRGDRELEWHSNPLGRIKRCVWKIATQPFSEAHFATFPPALVKTPLFATCPEYICKRCGKAREKIVESVLGYGIKDSNTAAKPEEAHNMSMLAERRQYYRSQGYESTPYKEIGLTDCGCAAGWDSGLVLDCFMGAGTVALVAMQNARNFLGIELNEEYIKMAMERLKPYLLQTRLL